MSNMPDKMTELSLLKERIAAIRVKLREIVCVEPPDKGVILLSNDSPQHIEVKTGKVVYDHEYFSPLGDALIELYELTGAWYEP